MHSDLHPLLLRDQYWEEVIPESLPHTVASEMIKDGPPVYSTQNIQITKAEAEIISPSLRSIDRQVSLGDPPETPSLTKRASMRSVRRERYSSIRSNTSINSNATRKGSIGGSKLSLFKRLISRENSSKLPLPPESHGGESGDVFGSNLNVSDTIPELDENLVTVVSTKREEEVRKPTVQEIFGKPQESGTTPTMFSFDEEMRPNTSVRSDEVHLLQNLSAVPLIVTPK